MARVRDKVSQQSRKELLGTFSQCKYIGLSIDGVAISTRKFLNVDIVNPVSRTCPFTHDFLTTSDLETPTFVNLFRTMLREMKDDGLCVGAVTSDGCAFQKKALNWKDPESIQARDPELSRLLFVPCICHRMQNAMTDLFRSNFRYGARIRWARDIAVFLRKPANREALDAGCPAHCATRLIYDYPLVRFIFNHRETVHHLVEETERQTLEEVAILIPLLEKVFLLVRNLEADHADCAQVYPKIKELVTYLQRHASTMDRSDWQAMYQECASVILRRTLENSQNLFHLAYVLTSDGRNDVRHAAIHEITEEPLPLEQLREHVNGEVSAVVESDGFFSEGSVPESKDAEDETIHPQMLPDDLEEAPEQEPFTHEASDGEEATAVQDDLRLESTALLTDAELGLREV
jgi:hypothetical protein